MSCEQDFINELRSRGMRMTPQREIILSVLHTVEGFVTAEDLHARVQQHSTSIDISTLYRTLELLKGLGLVAETDLGEGRVRYHPADKGHHHHLVCQECGAVIDLDESVLSPVKDVLLREYGFIADLRHLAIFGHCVNCKR